MKNDHTKKTLMAYLLTGLVFFVGLARPDEPVTYELSTPKAAFESLLKIVKARDVRGYYEILYKTEGMVTFEELAQRAKTGGDRSWKSLIFITQALFLGVERIAPAERGAPELARVWWRSGSTKQRGYLLFGLQEGKWKLSPNDESTETKWPDYDFSSPIAAFQSLQRAMRFDEWDTLGIYDALASDLKKGVSFEAYDRQVKEMLKRKQGEHPELRYEPDRLHVQELPVENGKSKCKIWKLSKEKKQESFEVFVKEGNEWKWIPDPKYVWYPKKK
jgi:hypothetical protein